MQTKCKPLYMKVKIKTILFKGKTLSDGSHPIVIRMNHFKRRKHISTGVSCFEEEWDVEYEVIKSPRFKKENEKIKEARDKVDGIMLYIKMNGIPFSFEAFNNKYQEKEIGGVFELYDEVMDELEQSDRLGNKAAYKQSKTSFERFYKKENLKFNQVDPVFLHKYEVFHLGNGCSKSGIAVYLRSFRSLFNIAIQRGLATREMYPFKNQFNANGYSMAKLKVGYNPKALDEKDLEKFKNFDYSEHPHLEEAFRMALFIYYARGINFIDISYLKWADTFGGRISYIRRKTKVAYSIKISPAIQEQLDYFKGIDEKYVFPIFSDFHKTENQKRYRMMKKRAQFNKKIKEIAGIVGIEGNMTSYILRHSFATTLKRQGASVELISQSMGHQNVEVTSHYLKSFGNDAIDELDDLL